LEKGGKISEGEVCGERTEWEEAFGIFSVKRLVKEVWEGVERGILWDLPLDLQQSNKQYWDRNHGTIQYWQMHPIAKLFW